MADETTILGSIGAGIGIILTWLGREARRMNNLMFSMNEKFVLRQDYTENKHEVQTELREMRTEFRQSLNSAHRDQKDRDDRIHSRLDELIKTVNKKGD